MTDTRDDMVFVPDVGQPAAAGVRRPTRRTPAPIHAPRGRQRSLVARIARLRAVAVLLRASRARKEARLGRMAAGAAIGAIARRKAFGALVGGAVGVVAAEVLTPLIERMYRESGAPQMAENVADRTLGDLVAQHRARGRVLAQLSDPNLHAYIGQHGVTDQVRTIERDLEDVALRSERGRQVIRLWIVANHLHMLTSRLKTMVSR